MINRSVKENKLVSHDIVWIQISNFNTWSEQKIDQANLYIVYTLH